MAQKAGLKNITTTDHSDIMIESLNDKLENMKDNADQFGQFAETLVSDFTRQMAKKVSLHQYFESQQVECDS